MTDRDRLAADLAATDTLRVTDQADRLIALGWTLRDGAYIGTVEPVIEWEIDEERLARALMATAVNPLPDIWFRDHAARVAKAYREDADAHN